MNKSKIWLAILVIMAVVMGATVLAEEKVSLRIIAYWTHAEPGTPIYLEVVEQFKKDYPNVEVVVEGLESASAREKIIIEMASGTPPDICQIGPSYAYEYSKQGLLLDLWPFIQADPEWRGYYTPALTSFLDDGKLYFLPVGTTLGGLYYNKRVFNRLGLEPPTTWEELLDVVKKVRAAGIHPFLTGGKEYRYAWFITQLMVRTSGVDKMRELATGSEVTGWNKPENGFIEALELFKELVDAGAFPRNVNGLSRDIARMMFVNDQGAMWYEGTWKISVFEELGGPGYVAENVGWVPFPIIEGAKGDQNAGVAGPTGFAVSSKLTKKQEEMALELVKRLTNVETATKLLVATNTPVLVKTDEKVWDEIHPILRKQLEYYETVEKIAMPSDIWFAPPVDNVIKEIVIPAIIEGTMTIEEAAEEVNKVAEKYFMN